MPDGWEALCLAVVCAREAAEFPERFSKDQCLEIIDVLLQLVDGAVTDESVEELRREISITVMVLCVGAEAVEKSGFGLYFSQKIAREMGVEAKVNGDVLDRMSRMSFGASREF